jgi:hypothetical protein
MVGFVADRDGQTMAAQNEDALVRCTGRPHGAWAADPREEFVITNFDQSTPIYHTHIPILAAGEAFEPSVPLAKEPLSVGGPVLKGRTGRSQRQRRAPGRLPKLASPEGGVAGEC